MNEEMQSYFFSFAFRLGGIVDSKYSREETLQNLTDDLSEMYGEDAFEILEFREATEEELSAVEAYRDGPPTIN